MRLGSIPVSVLLLGAATATAQTGAGALAEQDVAPWRDGGQGQVPVGVEEATRWRVAGGHRHLESGPAPFLADA